MKTTAASRIAAALMSVTVTLFVLNAVAMYGNPRPADPEAHLAAKPGSLATLASK
jgi:hypothetical protein